MGLVTETPKRMLEPDSLVGLRLGKRKMSRVLIVSDSGADANRLKAVFNDAGIASETAGSMALGCESAQSGRFGVIFSTPESIDGSWTRLIETAWKHGLDFEIVLLTRTFDLSQWSEAMQLGAFDVLDMLCDLSKAAEVAQRALGAGYLKRNRTSDKRDNN